MTRLWWVMGGCGLLGAGWPGIISNEVSGHFPVTRRRPSLSPRVSQATRSCRVIKPLILPQIVSVTVGFATTGKYEEEAGRSDRAGEWRGKEFPGEDDKCHVSSHRKVGRGSRAFSCHWPWLSLSTMISLAEEGTLHNTWDRAWENPLVLDKKEISWHKSSRPTIHRTEHYILRGSRSARDAHSDYVSSTDPWSIQGICIDSLFGNKTQYFRLRLNKERELAERA